MTEAKIYNLAQWKAAHPPARLAPWDDPGACFPHERVFAHVKQCCCVGKIQGVHFWSISFKYQLHSIGAKCRKTALWTD